MDFNFIGHIDGIRFSDTAVFVTASERRQGYKKKNGEIVADDLLTFRFIFKPYFRKYISEHFYNGMLVKIKGVMLPYAKDHEGNIVEGFSLIGETINRTAYQTTTVRREKKLLKESQLHDIGTPDLNGFNEPDF